MCALEPIGPTDSKSRLQSIDAFAALGPVRHFIAQKKGRQI